MQKETERREKAEYIAREIIAEARGRLVLHFPYLDQAIYGLRPLPLKSVPFGSDGSFLFYDPIFLIDQYERDENSALKLLLHTTLHMLFRQALVGVRIQRPLWNLACDIAVEHLTESFDLPGLKSGREEARKDVSMPGFVSIRPLIRNMFCIGISFRGIRTEYGTDGKTGYSSRMSRRS